jgi:uncharacterized protein YndB with AHSA1/START domain
MSNAQAVASYEFVLEIRASAAAVWQALTRQVDKWWLDSFRMSGPGAVITLDPEPGGFLIERTPEGGGLLWYQVLLSQPGEALHLAGFIGPDWGGPATSMLKLTLEERGSACVLRLADSLVGALRPDAAESLKKGWMELLGALKIHVESAERLADER